MPESLNSVSSSSLSSTKAWSRPSASTSTNSSANDTDVIEPSTLNPADDTKDNEDLVNAVNQTGTADNAKLRDTIKSTRQNPFAHYECPFGFEADLSEPVSIPKANGALRTTVIGEIEAITRVQGGLQSYCREINNGKHHFSSEFLEGETKATDIAVTQLDNIKKHLKALVEEVGQAGHDDHDVNNNLSAVYGHALQWTRHYRQIAVHSHVFYKYVLCAGY